MRQVFTFFDGNEAVFVDFNYLDKALFLFMGYCRFRPLETGFYEPDLSIVERRYLAVVVANVQSFHIIWAGKLHDGLFICVVDMYPFDCKFFEGLTYVVLPEFFPERFDRNSTFSH